MLGPGRRVLTIAHRAGNDLQTLRTAIALGIDYVEADVWHVRGRLEVRHEKTLGLLPVLWDRWSLRPGWTRCLLLDEVLGAAAGGGALLLDLKGRSSKLPAAVAAAVARARCAVAYTGGWAQLDRLAELAPEAPRFYTVGTRRRLARLRPRLDRNEIAAVSIDSRILDGTVVAALRRSGVRTIITWAVGTAVDAQRVLSWGVDGVTSKDLALLASLRREETERR